MKSPRSLGAGQNSIIDGALNSISNANLHFAIMADICIRSKNYTGYGIAISIALQLEKILNEANEGRLMQELDQSLRSACPAGLFRETLSML